MSGIYSGRLARDPEIKNTRNGGLITHNFIFVDTSRKDTDNRLISQMFEITLWDEDAKNLCENYKKGDIVHLVADISIGFHKSKENPGELEQHPALSVKDGGLVDQNAANNLRKVLREAINPDDDTANEIESYDEMPPNEDDPPF